jgi:hypothetical protein
MRAAVGTFVIAALAGSPTAALLCEALCSHSAPTAAVAERSERRGHHSAAAGHQSASHADHAASGHDDHSRAGATGVAVDPFEAHTGLRGPSRQDCCAFAQAHTSLAAARADTGRVPPSHLAVLPFERPLAGYDHHPARPRYGPPPGGPSSAGASLVLRI